MERQGCAGSRIRSWPQGTEIREATITKKTANPADVRECFAFLGTINASYRELVEAFGKPQPGDGYKIEAAWQIELIPGCFVEISNYKTSRSYDSKNPTIKRLREWNVHGTDSDAIEWIKAMLGQDTK